MSSRSPRILSNSTNSTNSKKTREAGFWAEEGRLPVSLLICMTAGAAVWRGYLAATYLPWGLDEFATWSAAANSDYLIMLLWDHHPTHPPLNYMLVRACMQLAGLQDMWVLRVPPCLFSVLSIPAAYWLGRALWGRWTALAFAGTVCFSPYLVHQAHNARMYSGHVFVTLIALAVVARMRLRSGSRSADWAILGVLAACLAWMSSTGLFVAAAIWMGLPLGMLLSRRMGCAPEEEAHLEWHSFVKRYVLATAVFLILMTPAILKLVCQYREEQGLLMGGEYGEPLAASLGRMSALQISAAGLGIATAFIGLGLGIRWRPVFCSILLMTAIIGIAVPAWQGRLASRYMLTAHLGTLVGLFLFVTHVPGARNWMKSAALASLVALVALANLGGPYVDTLHAARLLSAIPALEKDGRIYITPHWTKVMFDYYGIDAVPPERLEADETGLILFSSSPAGVSYLFAQPPGDAAERESYERMLLSLASHYQVGMTREQALAWIGSNKYLTFRFGEGMLEVMEYPQETVGKRPFGAGS